MNIGSHRGRDRIVVGFTWL